MTVRQDSPREPGLSRRQFVERAAALSAFMIVPRHVLGGRGHTPPSEQLNLAGIGAGGNMCRNDLDRCVERGAKVIAVADPLDFDGWLPVAQDSFRKNYSDAKIYRDYRELLDKEPNVDGVVVTTPDHWHAKITLDAMRRGKHVYTQKPLTRTISEARILADAAKGMNVATQMGNNGHAGEWIRLICEHIWNDAIGPVREVHAWSDRAGHFWPQGISRPAESLPTPANLDWDLWLGPAPARPYHPCYMPIVWRGWCDFGAGALGDMGCHILDPVLWALKLGHPTSVEATSTIEQPESKAETFPTASIVTYQFPARGTMPPVKIIWYDGGLRPPTPADFPAARKLAANGTIFVGDKGVLYNEAFQNPELLPAKLSKELSSPKRLLSRSPGHYEEWLGAAKGEDIRCESAFDYAAQLTEFVLLGTIAARVNERLEWDGPNMKITNHAEADKLVHHYYRSGWTL